MAGISGWAISSSIQGAAEAGAEAGLDAAEAGGWGSEAAATGAEAASWGSEVAGWGAEAASAGAAATASAAGAAEAWAAAGGAISALSLLNSLMFLASSAARSATSFSLRCWLISSSRVFCSLLSPLDSVSLSATGLADFLSSTRVSTAPLASRRGVLTEVLGARLASLRR
jgi:hypothetical protein